MTPFETAMLPTIRFGSGSLADVPEILATLRPGIGHVLIVADAVIDRLGQISRLAAFLKEARIAVSRFTTINGEPKDRLVDEIAERMRNAHAVVAIGGGATLDAAKLAAAVAGAHRPTADYALAAQPFAPRGHLVVCLPTTAGTGSEVTRTAIVSNAEGRKLWYWGDALRADAVVLDPALTVTVPAHITAWTGLDAATHALEASTSLKTNPMAALTGAEALRLIATHLPRAVADGHDREARSQMLWASTLAGIAIENSGTHIGHNISHALGSLAPIHHGLASALGLEAALPWLVEQPGDAADGLATAAAALGAERSAQALPGAFSALMRACAVAPGLPENCATLTAAEIAAAMKDEANLPMLLACPRPAAEADIDRLASIVAGSAKASAVA